MNALSTINLMPTRSEEVTSFAQMLVEAARNGEVNPLELAITMKAVQSSLDLVKESIKDLILAEAESHSAKTFEVSRAKVTITEVGTSYDYKNCMMPEWEMLDSQESDIKEKKKDLEARLKLVKVPETIMDRLTGEIITINPPIKKSTTAISIKLK